MAMANPKSELASVEIHEVLSNERRQHALSFLRDEGGTMTARELSERIAAVESGENPPPRNVRQSVYVSLHQTHLPKLDELGIVDYDQSAKTVHLLDRADEVGVYMETVPKYGISWSEYYVGVSFVGLLLLLATQIGVPLLGAVNPIAYATVLLALVAVSGVYQTASQGSFILNRLGR